jgi:hypothetical protein
MNKLLSIVGALAVLGIYFLIARETLRDDKKINPVQRQHHNKVDRIELIIMMVIALVCLLIDHCK